jgi:hypothetical protein
VQASARDEALSLEHPTGQPQKLLTGDLLRRLFNESAVPASDMRTEAEVVSWWQLYAGRVRKALKGGIPAAAPEGLLDLNANPLQGRDSDSTPYSAESALSGRGGEAGAM